jgi:hypothetical protein
MVCGEETNGIEAGQDPRKLYWRYCALFRESVSNAFPQHHANAARCSVYKRMRTPVASSRSQLRYPLKKIGEKRCRYFRAGPCRRSNPCSVAQNDTQRRANFCSADFPRDGQSVRAELMSLRLALVWCLGWLQATWHSSARRRGCLDLEVFLFGLDTICKETYGLGPRYTCMQSKS